MMATDPILVNSVGKPFTKGFNYGNINYRMDPIDMHVRFVAQHLIAEET